tara:strand:- start:3423 stop:4172 length:750 start_codon:yes stop_codon:yes gene_type:complete
MISNFLPLFNGIWFNAFLINFVVIFFGQKLPFLTKKGWIHAGVLGTLLLGSVGWKGWISVCVYLLLGTLVTKIGYKNKASRGIAEARGGLRGPENVWGSAATGCSLAILSCLFPENLTLFMVGFASSFTAKLSDTFSSEIGKRFGKRTFLITSLKSVEPGTEGAISIEGSVAGLLGSLIMTVVMINLAIISGLSVAFIVLLSGFLATIIESYIGAVAQNKINWLTNELVNSIQTSISAMISIYLYLIFI